MNSNSTTPLHLACSTELAWRGRYPSALAVVKRLLNSGADPRATNLADETPLHLAAAWRDRAIVEELLRHGAVVGALDYWWKTPLHFAAREANDDTADVLLSRSHHEVAARDDNHSTPLHLCCQFFPDDAQVQPRALAVIRQLLEHGAKAYGDTSPPGYSPHAIAESKGLQSVSALMEEYSWDSPLRKSIRRESGVETMPERAAPIVRAVGAWLSRAGSTQWEHLKTARPARL